jgi:ankyrin repeat protein
MWSISESDHKIIQLIKQFNNSDAGYQRLESDITAVIREGKDVNSRQGKNDRSALHYAAMYRDVKLVKILIKSGATIDLQDTDGQTPLWIAAANGDVAVVKILIKSGAKYIDCCKAMSDQDQAVLQTIADYASQQENKIIACFMLALLVLCWHCLHHLQ